jgi:hypothetical protein
VLKENLNKYIYIYIYYAPYDCGKAYVGQIGRPTGTRCKEHMRYTCLDQPGKSAVVKHRFEKAQY